MAGNDRRRVPAADVGFPAQVAKRLLPWELVVVETRQHPIVLARPAALAGVGLLAALVLTATIFTASAARVVLWFLWLILLGWAVWKFVNYRATHFVMTELRLVLYRGVFTVTVGMMPLGKVTDHRSEQTLTGRTFNYGSVIVETAGPDQALRRVDYLPFFDQLEFELLALLFPERNVPGSQDNDGT
jgi:uncharacterized membrane protein YdbT with pleckstrin-like domain